MLTTVQSAVPRGPVTLGPTIAAPGRVTAPSVLAAGTVRAAPVASVGYATAPRVVTASGPVAFQAAPAVQVATRTTTDSASLLAAGNVVSTRVISIEELAATGRYDAGAGFGAVPDGYVQASTAYDPALDVADAWSSVHQMMGADPSARVPLDAFVGFCMSRAAEACNSTNLALEYESYLNEVFQAALSLMLPSQKSDLGKHCFGYACILANEFYFGQPADMLSLKADSKPMDRLSQVRQEMDADWSAVAKDADGRVTIDAFVDYLMAKYASKLAAESQQSYQDFLVQDFRSALAMMLPEQKTTLGGHCFRYASLMAGEFYFQAANQALSGNDCGCSSPVADILGVTK